MGSRAAEVADLAGALSRLEDRELPLLNWGVVDGAMSQAEVRASVAQALQIDEDSADVVDTVDTLLDLGLLIDVPDRVGYRTRLAETVRLAALNRQLFGRGNGPWWTDGPRLVSDFRLDVRPRAYPRRDLTPSDLATDLTAASIQLDPEQLTVLAALTAQAPKLSRFQVDSTREILLALRQSRSTGVVVSAGTGSGKTLAFYLPAMLWLRARVTGGVHRTHALALYPRNELLKDQLAEAIRAASAASNAFRGGGGRDLRLGAFYGDTPYSVSWLKYASFQKSWPARNGGRVCPYLRCPADGCGNEVVWPQTSISQEVEELRCTTCSWSIGSDQLALTRKSMLDRPPDILFTTTEMVNRNSSNRKTGHLFGWNPATTWKPRLLLLDEVHTYEGVHGAQVGLLLRRWRHAVGRPVTVVGLSATLAEAPAFLSGLTGIKLADVQHVEPKPDDQILEGRQYQLVLRGDPLSGASLLSTSIQTVMLLARTLDVGVNGSGLYGSKAFVFTDNLDVVNRLYHDLRDAEGRGWMSRRRTAVDRVLANLRSPHHPDRQRRSQAGQSWDLVEAIGHRLPGTAPARPLDIAKTNSQDPGVADQADVIVATASLDVGYNDPRVGLVMQHKSPRNGGQFLQRRGRAGRVRQMRPMTVVTLSDYGRDRLAYQAYESLFDPEVTPTGLPVSNRYVLRMQATFALTDWLMRSLPWLSDVRALLQPEGVTYDGLPQVADRLESLLVDPETQQSLHEYLQRALGISADEAQAILWEPPRALLSAVVPTLLRRLRSRWQSFRDDPGNVPRTFAPDFVPRALFEPLAVPEVELLLPDGRDNLDTRMDVVQALREISPGRVSKRFAVDYGGQRTWVRPDSENGLPVIPLADFVRTGEVLGTWQTSEETYVVVRPHRIAVQQPPMNVRDTSQSIPTWEWEVVARTDGRDLDVPIRTPWATLVTNVTAYGHAQRSALEMRRYMTGATAEVRQARDSGRTHITFVDRHSNAAALGVALDVDGLRVTIALPAPETVRGLARLREPGWRALAFDHALLADPVLLDRANSFQLQWLHQAVLAALIEAALSEQTTLGAVVADLTPIRLRDLVRPWVSQLADPVTAEIVEAADDAEAEGEEPAGHIARLVALLDDDQVLTALALLCRRLQPGPVPDDDVHLAQRVLAETAASATYTAILRMLNDVKEEDLAVDITMRSDSAEIWITETTPGGSGILERVQDGYQVDPRRFWRLVHNSLAAADAEVVDVELTRFLRHIVNEPASDLFSNVHRVRAAGDNASLRQAFQDMLVTFRGVGGRATHAVTSSIASRPLRPGWTPATDAQVLATYDARRTLENRLGFEVDERTWSCLVARVDSLRDPTMTLTARQLYGSLWPSTSRAHNRHLILPAPYGTRAPVDRQLLLELLPSMREYVHVSESDWMVQATSALQEQGVVDLLAHPSDRQNLRRGLLSFLSDSLEVGYLLVHPVVRAVSAVEGGLLRVSLELQEVEQ